MKTVPISLVALGVLVPVLAAAEPLSQPVLGLERLVGTWKGGGSLAAGPDTAKLTATWACQRVSARYGVSCSLHVTGIPGVPSYEETDLMGYEPGTNTYHWYSVTNAGETHDHVASVAKDGAMGNAIQFVFKGSQGGKPFEEVISLSFQEKDQRVVGKAETFVAGASTSMMDLSLHK